MSRQRDPADRTYLVAYDGRAPSEAALGRAASFAERTDVRLVVVSVLPTDGALAETYDLAEDGTYDPDAAAERLRAAVEDVAPSAAFRAVRADAYAGKRRIAAAVARAASQEGADVVFLGSDDPGRVVRRVTRGVPDADTDVDVDADGGDYDVFVVRSR